MGHEYRDDLRSAHERIARLEEELARERAPKRPKDRGWLVGFAVGGFFFVGFVGVLAFVFVRSSARPVAVEAPVVAVPAAVPYVPMVATRFYAQRMLPLRADVDGDGKKELIGLFWGGSTQEPLWVAALDPDTFVPKWANGPYRAQWSGTRTHLAVVGKTVLVSDSQETLHVLSLADGKEVAQQTLAGGITQMCPAMDMPAKVRLRVGDGYPADLRLFDPETRSIDKAKNDLPCGGAVPACDDRNQDVCEGRGRGEIVPPTERYESFVHVFGSGERRVATTYDRDGAEMPIIGWKRGAKALDWRSADLVVTGDARHFGMVRNKVGHGRIATLYQLKSGSFRVVVRDMETGKELGKAIVPRSTEGSYLDAFGVDGDDVFIAMDQKLIVYDARDASLRRDLEMVQLPSRAAGQ